MASAPTGSMLGAQKIGQPSMMPNPTNPAYSADVNTQAMGGVSVRPQFAYTTMPTWAPGQQPMQVQMVPGKPPTTAPVAVMTPSSHGFPQQVVGVPTMVGVPMHPGNQNLTESYQYQYTVATSWWQHWYKWYAKQNAANMAEPKPQAGPSAAPAQSNNASAAALPNAMVPNTAMAGPSSAPQMQVVMQPKGRLGSGAMSQAQPSSAAPVMVQVANGGMQVLQPGMHGGKNEDADDGKRHREADDAEHTEADDNKRQRKGEKKTCKNCGTDNTPFWRKDKVDGTPLCNACGLYAAKNDAARPSALWKQDKNSFLSVNSSLTLHSAPHSSQHTSQTPMSSQTQQAGTSLGQQLQLQKQQQQQQQQHTQMVYNPGAPAYSTPAGVPSVYVPTMPTYPAPRMALPPLTAAPVKADGTSGLQHSHAEAPAPTAATWTVPKPPRSTAQASGGPPSGTGLPPMATKAPSTTMPPPATMPAFPTAVGQAFPSKPRPPVSVAPPPQVPASTESVSQPAALKPAEASAGPVASVALEAQPPVATAAATAAMPAMAMPPGFNPAMMTLPQMMAMQQMLMVSLASTGGAVPQNMQDMQKAMLAAQAAQQQAFQAALQQQQQQAGAAGPAQAAPASAAAPSVVPPQVSAPVTAPATPIEPTAASAPAPSDPAASTAAPAAVQMSVAMPAGMAMNPMMMSLANMASMMQMSGMNPAMAGMQALPLNFAPQIAAMQRDPATMQQMVMAANAGAVQHQQGQQAAAAAKPGDPKPEAVAAPMAQFMRPPQMASNALMLPAMMQPQAVPNPVQANGSMQIAAVPTSTSPATTAPAAGSAVPRPAFGGGLPPLKAGEVPPNGGVFKAPLPVTAGSAPPSSGLPPLAPSPPPPQPSGAVTWTPAVLPVPQMSAAAAPMPIQVTTAVTPVMPVTVPSAQPAPVAIPGTIAAPVVPSTPPPDATAGHALIPVAASAASAAAPPSSSAAPLSNAPTTGVATLSSATAPDAAASASAMQDASLATHRPFAAGLEAPVVAAPATEQPANGETADSRNGALAEATPSQACLDVQPQNGAVLPGDDLQLASEAVDKAGSDDGEGDGRNDASGGCGMNRRDRRSLRPRNSVVKG